MDYSGWMSPVKGFHSGLKVLLLFSGGDKKSYVDAFGIPFMDLILLQPCTVSCKGLSKNVRFLTTFFGLFYDLSYDGFFLMHMMIARIDVSMAYKNDMSLLIIAESVEQFIGYAVEKRFLMGL